MQGNGVLSLPNLTITVYNLVTESKEQTYVSVTTGSTVKTVTQMMKVGHFIIEEKLLHNVRLYVSVRNEMGKYSKFLG